MKTITMSKVTLIAVAAAGASLIWSAGFPVQAQEPSPAKTESAAMAKADTEWDGVTCELAAVKRTEGETILIQFKYTNTGSKNAKLTPAYEHDNISELVYYVDPKNKKKYTVIKDSDNKPLSNSLVHVTLEAGASKLGWAKLPAPPADVTSVTVFIPGAPPFEKVTLAAQ